MRKLHWYFDKNSSIKLYNWRKNTSLKYFRHIWKYAEWYVVIFKISATFLYTDVIFAFFKKNGKLDFLTESIKLAKKMSAKISAFSFMFVGISVSRHASEVSNLKIFLRISSVFIFEKKNCSSCILLRDRVCWDASYILQHILKQW